jgi:hypothetical protein
MLARKTCLGGLAVLVLAGAASADWNPGDTFKMHYPQLPDLEPTGMDVWNGFHPNAPVPGPGFKWLADDFRCTESGPILDVHLWGSWLNDRHPGDPTTPGLPPGLPGTPGSHGRFELAIYSDVPATPTSPSHPGELLWRRSFGNGQYLNRLYARGPETFYDPNSDQIIGTDSEVWQYNFLMNPTEAFYQQRDQIYWLAVLNWDANGDGVQNPEDLSSGIFGWKTSRDHFNDDAVFGDFGMDFNGMPMSPEPGWGREMRYPQGHPFHPQSVDLAFVITPTPGAASLLGLGALVLTRRRR